MTAVPSVLPDACTSCPDFPATLPHTVTPTGTGSLRVEYRCQCGHQWTCWWDAESAGWPTAKEQAA